MNGQYILGATDAQLPQHVVCTKQGQVPIQACGTHVCISIPAQTLYIIYFT